MGLVARRSRSGTQTRSSEGCSPSDTPRRNGDASGDSSGKRSLAQTRLDRIASPTATYHQAFSRWLIRLLNDPETYPAAELKRHLQDELGPERSRLRVLVTQPPAELTGEEWEAAEDRLRRLEGKADAITRVLETRTRGAAPRPRRLGLGMRAQASAPASPSTASPDPLDPFSAE